MDSIGPKAAKLTDPWDDHGNSFLKVFQNLQKYKKSFYLKFNISLIRYNSVNTSTSMLALKISVLPLFFSL